jgi:alpha-L-fucosidase
MRFSDQAEVERVPTGTLAATPEGVARFTAARYGLTMHWGLYALNGRGEWVYFREQIPWASYQQRMAAFNPVRFDAEEWADLVLESGARFLMITTKHHDGFCLWDSALTTFKVTNTPCRRDLLAELAPALRDRGLGLHFYYSLVDWTHPAYRRDWPAYVAYYQGQVRELLTNYGPLAGVLFDGYWPRTIFETAEEKEYFPARGAWDLAGTYNLIHQLQPAAVLTNNTHILPLPGEDYQVFELDLPGENTQSFNTTQVGKQPLAVWYNLNAGWAYEPRRHDVKSAETMTLAMEKVFKAKAVFFLNVGPRPFGDIHPDEQRVLREIGRLVRNTHAEPS